MHGGWEIRYLGGGVQRCDVIAHRRAPPVDHEMATTEGAAGSVKYSTMEPSEESPREGASHRTGRVHSLWHGARMPRRGRVMKYSFRDVMCARTIIQSQCVVVC